MSAHIPLSQNGNTSPSKLSSPTATKRSPSVSIKKSSSVAAPNINKSIHKSRNSSRAGANGIKTTDNKIKSNIDIFRENFEGNFAKHDEIEEYKVRNNMLEPYLSNNGELSKNKKIWLELFKKHRYLLYLDQFINFVTNYYHTLTNFVADGIKKDNYYALPIANSVNSAMGDDIDKMQQMYSDRLYSEIEQINNTYISKQPEITGISLIFSHGGYSDDREILTVPDNIIIAFIMPLNKFGYQIDEDFNQIVYTLNEYKSNGDFLKNPACYLRNNMCFNNTTYYYPGQKILNYDLTINLPKDTAKMGFYNIATSNKDIPANEKIKLFKTTDNINYSITLRDIFTTKNEILNHKILFISCCRKCDFYLTSKQVELVYRYEHIITYLNMSRCSLEVKDKTLYKCRTDKSILGHDVNTMHIELSKNLFYDSALSYDFKENYTKKGTYMLSSSNSPASANNLTNPSSNKTLKNQLLNTKLQMLKSANNNIKYTKISDILRSLIHNSNNIGSKLFMKNILIVLDYINEYKLTFLYEQLIKLLFKNKNINSTLLFNILFKICLNYKVDGVLNTILESSNIYSVTSFVDAYKQLFVEYKLDFNKKEYIIFSTMQYIFNNNNFSNQDNIYFGTSIIRLLWDLHIEILNIEPLETKNGIYLRNGSFGYKDGVRKITGIRTSSYYNRLFKYLADTYIENFEYSSFYAEQSNALFDYSILTISELKPDNSCKWLMFDEIHYEILDLFKDKFIIEDRILHNAIDYFAFPFCIAILGQDINLITVLWSDIVKNESVCTKKITIPCEYLCLIFYLMIYHRLVYNDYFMRNKLIPEIILTLIKKIDTVSSEYNMLYVALHKLYTIKLSETDGIPSISVSTNEVIQKICADPNIKIRDPGYVDSSHKNYIEQFINKYNQIIATSSTPIDNTFLDNKQSNSCAAIFLE